MGRQVKKTVVKYTSSIPHITSDIQQKRQRSRDKQKQKQKQKDTKDIINQIKRQEPIQKNKIIIQEVVDTNSRKSRLDALKKAKQLREKEQSKTISMQNNMQSQNSKIQMPEILIVSDDSKKIIQSSSSNNQLNKVGIDLDDHQSKIKLQNTSRVQQKPQVKLQAQNKPQQEDSDEEVQEKILLKPVFLSRQNRTHIDQESQQKQKQQQRKKKNLKYTTKLLLQQDKKNANQEQEEQDINNQDQDNQTNLPDDNDQVNEQLQYQMWKIRELKRIRKEKQDRQKHIIEKAEIQRRRKMDNQQILIQNRLLGSDSTDNQNETKYVFMQKYYHKGAFYQDSDDAIFKRDYNLPTPMEMQDKSGLPEALQKRKGDFGKRGQSKYTHLTAEDTTDTNPLTRPDQSLLNGWKKKMAGYKN